MNTTSITKYLVSIVFAIYSLSNVQMAMAWHWNEDDYNWKRANIEISGENVGYTISKFDGKGNRIGEKTYLDGTMKEERKYSLNSKGQSTKIEVYDSRGKLEAVHTFSYNAQGRLIKLVEANDSGKLQKYTTFNYDTKGRLDSAETFDSNDRYLYHLVVVKHGEGETTIDMYEGGEERPSFFFLHEYDAKDNLVKSELFEGDRTTDDPRTSYTYEY